MFSRLNTGQRRIAVDHSSHTLGNSLQHVGLRRYEKYGAQAGIPNANKQTASWCLQTGMPGWSISRVPRGNRRRAMHIRARDVRRAWKCIESFVSLLMSVA